MAVRRSLSAQQTALPTTRPATPRDGEMRWDPTGTPASGGSSGPSESPNEPDEQRIQRLDANTASRVAWLNADHRARAASAAPFTEAWGNLARWRTAGTVAIVGGRLVAGGASGLVGRDWALAPGQTGIARMEFYASATSGQILLFGVSNVALGSTPPTPDVNGVYIGVSGGTASIHVGSNVGTTGNLASAGSPPALPAGSYIATIAVDRENITLCIQGASDPKGFYACRIPRTNLPGGTGAVNCIGIGLNNSTTAAHTTAGPMAIITGDHQPPRFADLRTVGGKALWDYSKPTYYFRTNPAALTNRWLVRLPGNYDPESPSPQVLYMHGASGNVFTPWSSTQYHPLTDQILDPGNMILASSDGGPTGDYDGIARPSSSADYTALAEWVRANFATAGLHLHAISGGGYQMWNILAERRLGGIVSAQALCIASDMQSTASDPTYQSLVFNAWGVSSLPQLAAAAVGRDPILHAARQYRAVPVFFSHYATDTVTPIPVHTTPMKAKIDAWGAAETEEVTIAGTGHYTGALYTAAMLAFMQRHEGARPPVPSAWPVQPYSDANAPGSLMMTEAPEPPTPPDGKVTFYSVDGTALLMKDDAGVVRTVGPGGGGGGGGTGTELAATQDYTSTSPSSPATGIKMFSRHRARRVPAFVGPTGQDSALQPALFSNRVNMLTAVPQSTAFQALGGMPAPAFYGTASNAAAPSAASFFASLTRQRIAGGASGATQCGFRSGYPVHFSSTPNKGGFFWVLRCGVNLGQSGGGRGMFGLSTFSTAIPNQDYTGFTQMVGFGWAQGETTMKFVCNDQFGSPTVVDLGANFPTTNYGTYFYEFRMFAPSGGGQQVYWSATRLNDGLVTSGSANSDLPTVDVFMYTHAIYGTTTTVTGNSLDVQSLYIETDN